MKKITVLFLTIIITSCSTVEERINDYSYTELWHYEKGEKYQVYRTKKNSLYITKLNKKETKFVRKYIK
jgi:hypothetical protein|tara:strand:+ start:1528 stop:1734 length:207 start_codon:yes stop_codon:yes gene_type:complete